MYNAYEIGERLANYREQNGFSQEGLAEKIGCSAITISRWENGHTRMKDQDICNVCSALDISSDSLLGLHREKNCDIENMLEGLTEKQKAVVHTTLAAMIAAMKN